MLRTQSLSGQLTNKLAILIIVFITFVVYFNGLFNDFIIGDDYDQIVNNSLIQDVKNIPSFFQGSTYYQAESDTQWGPFYRPLMLTSYTFIMSIFGMDPLFFHLIQLILHTANAVLVYVLFHKLLQDKSAALIAALLFAVHPLNSEAVLHIASLQEVLFLFFGLLQLILITKRPLSILSWIVIGGIQALALFSKETAIMLFILGFGYQKIIQNHIQKQLVLTTLLSTGSYLCIRLIVAGLSLTTPTIGAINDLPSIVRLAHIPTIIVNYLKRFVYPYPLAIHQSWFYQPIQIEQILYPILVLSLVSIMVLSIHKKILNNAKRSLYLLAWIALGLLPHIHIIPLYSTVADRWAYLPLIGFIGWVVLVGQKYRKFKQIKYLALVVVIIFSYRTYARTYDWQDSYTLFSTDLPKTEKPYFTENLLATHYIKNDQFQAAKPLLINSVNSYPFIGNLSNLGVVYQTEGDLTNAEHYLRQAANKGNIYNAVINYANFLTYIKKDHQTAYEYIAAHLNTYSNSPDLWMAQAYNAHQLENPTAAFYAANRAHKIQPIPLSLEILTAIKQDRDPQISPYIKY